MGKTLSHPGGEYEYIDVIVEYHLRQIVAVVSEADKQNLRKAGVYALTHQVHNAPQKHLLAFEKVHLTEKFEAVVSFKVDVCKDLSVVDELGNRKLALGEHVLHVGDLKHPLGVMI
ncbi:unnamed protein product [Vicia faba]|uniref:Fibronectin type III-like domain-containing protein n=1 Tax=Vicia faba TaxID=3906 RepID=A0AAV0ZDR3_VICFA|nr:unnamed protein product [Vicia faba]